MGSFHSSETKPAVETEMNTNKNMLVDEYSEAKQMLPICKENSVQNKSTTEKNVNQTADKFLDNVKNKKSIKLSFKEFGTSTEDLKVLSNQLHEFLKYISRAQKFEHYVFELPSQLENKWDAYTKELDSLYLKISEASKKIEKVKKKNNAMQKENRVMKKVLLLKTELEKEELETTVSIYDSVMYEHWQAVKSYQSVNVLQCFLAELEDKLQALKNLKKLASDKLFKIQAANGESDLNSHTTSTDNLLESESDGTTNIPFHIEMNSVLQELFGEQIPSEPSSSALGGADL